MPNYVLQLMDAMLYVMGYLSQVVCLMSNWACHQAREPNHGWFASLASLLPSNPKRGIEPNKESPHPLSSLPNLLLGQGSAAVFGFVDTPAGP